MNIIQKKVFIKLLKDASEHFSSHCCNDFDLRDVLNEDEIKEFQKYYYQWVKKDDPMFEGRYCSIEMDWLLMSYFIDIINNEV